MSNNANGYLYFGAILGQADDVAEEFEVGDINELDNFSTPEGVEFMTLDHLGDSCSVALVCKKGFDSFDYDWELIKFPSSDEVYVMHQMVIDALKHSFDLNPENYKIGWLLGASYH